MAITQSLFGVDYHIPETRNRSWGPTVTAALLNLMKAEDASAVSPDNSLVLPNTTSTMTASSTLTKTRTWHQLAATGGPVTLSTVTAIADGSTVGEVLVLSGTNSVDTVTIPDGANTELNGLWTAGERDVLVLVWNGTDWFELWRNY